MKKITLCVLLLLAPILTFAAANSIIRGRVLDENNLPLPGATVLIESLKLGTVTDIDGYFSILNLEEGKYNISVSYFGYQPQVKELNLEDSQTSVLEFKMELALNSLNEVLIKGSIANGQAKALNKQKNNDNITNIVSSDQVGKFPDANIGDALKRIPGIAMQNDQGEARNIIIRGMAPQLNSVTVNGDRLPSAEGDNRLVQMDLIPSNMIQAIEVNKAVTSDMEGDAIGGSVNLVTRSAPSGFRAALTGSFGQNPVRNGDRYDVAVLVADRMLNDKLGVVVSATHNSNDYGSDNVEFEWETPSVLKEHDIRRYDVKRVRSSISANLDYKWNKNNTLFIKSIFNKRDDTENRFRTRYKYDSEDQEYKISRQTKGGIDNDENNNRRLERQKTSQYSIGGEHLLFNIAKVDWKVGTSKASEERPNERYITFENKFDAALFTQNATTTKFPYITGPDNIASEYELDEVSEEFQFTEEEKLNTRINISLPLQTKGTFKNSLKVGLKFNHQTKERVNNFIDYTDYVDGLGVSTLSDVPNSSQTINGFLAGDQYKAGVFADASYLGSLSLGTSSAVGEQVFGEFVPVNYNATENIYAAYGMLKQELGEKLSMIVGLRIERTSIAYTGYEIDVETASSLNDATEIKAEKNYTNWLPNLQFKYSVTENDIVRLAWTNTIGRPSYYDLVPYKSVNSDDMEYAQGNPNLKAAASMNFDLMAEHYFKNIGIISAGGFYKKIDHWFYTYKDDSFVDATYGTDAFDYEQVRNGNVAEVYGVELALQYKLDFLPSILKNLSFYGNYTYTDSKADGVEGRGKVKMSGTVKNMINTSLAYETSKFNARVSLNHAGSYIDEFGDDETEDIYYGKQTFLDVNSSYQISKGLSVFAEAKNLTNQGLRYYQGHPQLTRQAEFYDVNWNLGLRYNF
ncbi:TonB-dependent receptor [Flavicella sediminum]|uniref:TonB-dependent receptor n=1 Tax=Flavicella sediminum TaxID=2585141 RepID=UPI0011228971|nr:TonB-dependent receptor [Flavicella sediminum]